MSEFGNTEAGMMQLNTSWHPVSVPTAKEVAVLRAAYVAAHRHHIGGCHPDYDSYHAAIQADDDTWDAWLAASNALKESTK
jgi:hypothetical protein